MKTIAAAKLHRKTLFIKTPFFSEGPDQNCPFHRMLQDDQMFSILMLIVFHTLTLRQCCTERGSHAHARGLFR